MIENNIKILVSSILSQILVENHSMELSEFYIKIDGIKVYKILNNNKNKSTLSWFDFYLLLLLNSISMKCNFSISIHQLFKLMTGNTYARLYLNAKKDYTFSINRIKKSIKILQNILIEDLKCKKVYPLILLNEKNNVYNFLSNQTALQILFTEKKFSMQVLEINSQLFNCSRKTNKYHETTLTIGAKCMMLYTILSNNEAVCRIKINKIKQVLGYDIKEEKNYDELKNKKISFNILKRRQYQLEQNFKIQVFSFLNNLISENIIIHYQYLKKKNLVYIVKNSC